MIAGLSGDGPHDGSQERKCEDCPEIAPAWSQCEPHRQGESGFLQIVCIRVWNEDCMQQVLSTNLLILCQ